MNIRNKTRFEKLIYGLLYPAFFGNMIYDLILRKQAFTENGILHFPNLFSCILIIVFSIIDYLHLYGDMNEIASTAENKSDTYLFCDLATPILIFLSFVFIKEGWNIPSIIMYNFIPLVIYSYKRKNPNNKYFIYYSILMWTMTIPISIFYFYNREICNYLTLTEILIGLVFYTYYVFIYYPNKCRSFDEDHFAKYGIIYSDNV